MFTKIIGEIDKYNTSIQKGTAQTHLFVKELGAGSFKTYVSSLNGAKASMSGYIKQVGVATIKEKALTAARQAGAMALNSLWSIGIGLAISAVVAGITKLINKHKELADKASESTSTLKDEAAALDDYKEKISALKTTLDNNNVSTEDAYNARKQLISIQDELCDKYGLEKSNIDLVNGSLKENIALLDEKAVKSAEDWQRDNKSAINDAKDTVKKKSNHRGSFDYGSLIDLPDLKQTLVHKGLAEYGEYSFDYNYFDSTVDEAISKYQELYDVIDKYREDNFNSLTDNQIDDIETLLGDVSNSIIRLNSEDYQQAKAIYDQNVESLLLTEKAYKDTYSNILDIKEQYDEAVANDDKAAMDKAASDMVKIKELYQAKLSDGQIKDTGVQKWFDTFFSDFSATVTNNNSPFTKMSEDILGSLDVAVKRACEKFDFKSAGDLTSELVNVLGIDTQAEIDLFDECTKQVDTLGEAFELYKSKVSGVQVTDDTSVFEDFATTLENASKKTKLLSTAMTEMNEQGYISTDTYADLIAMGGNYADCITVENGKLVFNAQKLKELETQQYQNKISTNELTIAQLQYNAAVLGASGNSDAISAIVAQIDELRTQNGIYKTLVDDINNAKADEGKSTSSTKSEVPAQVTAFEKAYADKQHEINMGRMEQDTAYYDWLETASKNAYSGLADYEDDLYKYEEEVYKGRKDLDDDLFQKRMENLENYAEKATSDLVDSNGSSLSVTASFDYSKSQYEQAIKETQSRIDGIKAGVVSGNADDIDTLIDKIEDYRDKIDGINETAISSEKEYWETLKNEYDDYIDERIDSIKKVSDEVENSYDKQIDAVDRQINALKKVADEEDRRLKIADAQKAIDEAKAEDAANSFVSFNGSGMTVVDTHEAETEAKKNLADVVQENQIAILEDQKSLIEEQKNNATDYYSKVEEQLTEQKETQDKIYEAITTALDIDDKKQTESNLSVLKSVDTNGEIQSNINSLSGVGANNEYTVATDENTKALKNLTSSIDKSANPVKEPYKVIGGEQSNISEFDKTRTDKGLTKDIYGMTSKGERVYSKDAKMNKILSDSINLGANIPNILANIGERNTITPIGVGGNTSLDKNSIRAINTSSSPQMNFTVNIEGSADEKTVTKFKSVVDDIVSKAFYNYSEALYTK